MLSPSQPRRVALAAVPLAPGGGIPTTVVGSELPLARYDACLSTPRHLAGQELRVLSQPGSAVFAQGYASPVSYAASVTLPVGHAAYPVHLSPARIPAGVMTG
mmetsp:Transcript_103805/g.274943  ORF Transcript_103805/g.274943 Transcript_103805/m.274943 type:complete len:103 (-) Transcript_103805:16-324(-)